MRDFRFRAWHKDAKEMLQSRQQGYHGNVFAWLAEGQPVEIMQYIGRNDENDNEICEGDLVKVSNPKQQIQNIEIIGEVRFSNFGSYKICNIKKIKWENFTYGVEPPKYIWFLNLGDRKLEIIGNIWENPELMEKSC